MRPTYTPRNSNCSHLGSVVFDYNAELLQHERVCTEAVSKSDVVFIAVGTPSRRGDGHAGIGRPTSSVEIKKAAQ